MICQFSLRNGITCYIYIYIYIYILNSIGNRKDRFWNFTNRSCNAQISLIFELGTMCEQLCEAGCGDPQNAGGQFM